MASGNRVPLIERLHIGDTVLILSVDQTTEIPYIARAWVSQVVRKSNRAELRVEVTGKDPEDFPPMWASGTWLDDHVVLEADLKGGW